MSGQQARGYFGISEVLAQLRPEFPDISVSKIRFLETEGLIAPARSPAGYRRFAGHDVDRLRFVLAAQRDQYLPLRVIRERLDRLDQVTAEPHESLSAGHSGYAQDGKQPVSRTLAGRGLAGEVPAGRGQAQDGDLHRARDQRQAGAGASAQSQSPSSAMLLTRRELLDEPGMSEALLTELETFGLLRRVGRQYGPDAVEVARTAVALASFGVEARHLRAVRAAAERESTMIESLVAPILRQHARGAKELAGRTARECALLVLRLHGALVEGALAEAGLAEPGVPDADLRPRPGAGRGLVASQDSMEGPDRSRQRSRGVAGGATVGGASA
jgi:DNA-binding transcriptional MerR regulator